MHGRSSFQETKTLFASKLDLNLREKNWEIATFRAWPFMVEEGGPFGKQIGYA
jgi:hypothetical protein